MEQYDDLPMDLADATLFALAEREKASTIFTIDSDFEVYRLPGKKRLVRSPRPYGGPAAIVRNTRGQEIDGACGQLAAANGPSGGNRDG